MKSAEVMQITNERQKKGRVKTNQSIILSADNARKRFLQQVSDACIAMMNAKGSLDHQKIKRRDGMISKPKKKTIRLTHTS